MTAMRELTRDPDLGYDAHIARLPGGAPVRIVNRGARERPLPARLTVSDRSGAGMGRLGELAGTG